MYFPVADITVIPWVPPLTAFVISFFTSMGGVSGAFLLLPFQVSVLGYTNPSVSSTNQLFNIVAIPSGVYRYIKEGRMVWPLAWIVVIGTLPGVLIGAIVRINFLPDPRNFKLFAGLVLLYIGLRLVKDLVKKPGKDEKASSEKRFQELAASYRKRSADAGIKGMLPPVSGTRVTLVRVSYDFYGEHFDVPIWGIFTLAFVVGIVGGIYGIGGGAIIAPFFVSFFRLPVYTVAGAALMATFVTSAAGVLFYQLMAPFYAGISVAPDWTLGILFGIGGMAGMYLGARMQKFMPARAIKCMLASVIAYTAFGYIFSFFK